MCIYRKMGLQCQYDDGSRLCLGNFKLFPKSRNTAAIYCLDCKVQFVFLTVVICGMIRNQGKVLINYFTLQVDILIPGTRSCPGNIEKELVQQKFYHFHSVPVSRLINREFIDGFVKKGRVTVSIHKWICGERYCVSIYRWIAEKGGGGGVCVCVFVIFQKILCSMKGLESSMHLCKTLNTAMFKSEGGPPPSPSFTKIQNDILVLSINFLPITYQVACTWYPVVHRLILKTVWC